MKKDIQTEYIFDLMKNKDPKGFELLYENHFRKIYGIAFSVLKDDAKSHDVVQNVMLKLYRLEYDKFPKNYELSWLYTVSKNEALQLLRKDKNTVNIEEVPEIKMPKSNIDDFTDMQYYYSLIESLNEKQKNIVTLKVLGGLSHKEISKILNIPTGTIQWIYNTSIKKLRVALSGLSILVFASGSVFANRVMKYLNGNDNQIPEIDLPEINPIPVQSINGVVVWGVVFAICIIALIIFFRKSEKIPTKRLTKNI